MTSRIMLFAILSFTFAAAPATQQVSRKTPFLLGADISWVPEDEADGAKYFDQGKQEDVFQILHDYRFNAIRLRLFVDPAAPGGYSFRRGESFCDLAHTLAMAHRAKSVGMYFLLDFHYSDNWADPAHQRKP